jgi:tetratricopeptide (TPR) repeat protein
MTSQTNADGESVDVEKVDAAMQAIMSGNLDRAETLLLAVIANTPSEYSNCEDHGETVSIRFWDQTTFIHYVTWQQDQGLAQKGINWIGNAYPRAHYYMGFLCVKRRQFQRAIEFLDKGLRLEPTNPMLALEKAQALVHLGRTDDALAIYDGVTEIGPHVSARDVAVARRGQRSGGNSGSRRRRTGQCTRAAESGVVTYSQIQDCWPPPGHVGRSIRRTVSHRVTETRRCTNTNRHCHRGSRGSGILGPGERLSEVMTTPSHRHA